MEDECWQIYRFEFNPPRVWVAPYFIIEGRRVVKYERHSWGYDLAGVECMSEWVGFDAQNGTEAEWYEYRSARMIDGCLYTTKNVADSIFAPQPDSYGPVCGESRVPEVDRFKNALAGVLGLSPVLCLDVIVRVVCFL